MPSKSPRHAACLKAGIKPRSKAVSRIALCVEYDGSAYRGWQAQKSPQLPTVQEALEKALSRVADHPVRVLCAGRTDAGVHASAQIVHFDTEARRPLQAWVKGGNAFLPGAVSVRWAKPVSLDFHARFSALSRRYRYIVYNDAVRPALLRDLVTTHPFPLNHVSMAEAGQLLLGERDFTSYRAAACQSSTPMRHVRHLKVNRYGQYVVIDIEANAFLLHMVRNIAGVLLEIGEGRHQPQWAAEVLDRKDRSCAAATAPPQGLYLVQVLYPEHFHLPSEEPGPAFLQATMTGG
ncbi:MAG: tRNA pseudouridine(38-40) synthase TruA [Pseudomonadales bacterium]|nr:tRNA pseudouridine(38-40) synthase TruA [Pseudomonadales bacterium]